MAVSLSDAWAAEKLETLSGAKIKLDLDTAPAQDEFLETLRGQRPAVETVEKEPKSLSEISNNLPLCDGAPVSRSRNFSCTAVK